MDLVERKFGIRQANQARPGGRLKNKCKTERDGGNFPWTCVPQGVEENTKKSNKDQTVICNGY